MGMISREVRGRAHFLLGLLHDIGKVILNYRFSDYFREVLRIAGEQNRSIYDNEPPDGSRAIGLKIVSAGSWWSYVRASRVPHN